MKAYSVLLLYPDYTTNQFGETYYTFVDAGCPKEALYLAQKEAGESNDCDPTDFACLLCIEGEHPALDTDEVEPPAGYTAEELERDNPYNQWMYES